MCGQDGEGGWEGGGGRTVKRPRLIVPTNLAAVTVRDILDVFTLGVEVRRRYRYVRVSWESELGE